MTFAIRRSRPRMRRQALTPRFFDDEWLSRALGMAFNDSPGWLPPVDIEETDDAVIVSASLPGYRQEDISITSADGALIIEGAHADKPSNEGSDSGRYHVRERRAGRFFRRIPLPVRTTSTGSTATYENGVLKVRIPKADEARAATIAIESA